MTDREKMDLDQTPPRRPSSLLLLVDGYNVVAPTAPPRNPGTHWLHRERMQLLRRLAEHLDAEARRRTCVVFDAANPPADRSHQLVFQQIEVRFAVNYPEADDLLEELIAAHSAPKTLAVVSSDQRVQTAAKRRGSACFDSQPWLDDVLDGHVWLAITPPTGPGLHAGPNPMNGPDFTAGAGQGDVEKPTVTSDDDVEKWMREFGFDED